MIVTCENRTRHRMGAQCMFQTCIQRVWTGLWSALNGPLRVALGTWWARQITRTMYCCSLLMPPATRLVKPVNSSIPRYSLAEWYIMVHPSHSQMTSAEYCDTWTLLILLYDNPTHVIVLSSAYKELAYLDVVLTCLFTLCLQATTVLVLVNSQARRSPGPLMPSERGFANILLPTSIGIQETACFAPGEDDHP